MILARSCSSQNVRIPLARFEAFDPESGSPMGLDHLDRSDFACGGELTQDHLQAP